jgi:hypothetical protein
MTLNKYICTFGLRMAAKNNFVSEGYHTKDKQKIETLALRFRCRFRCCHETENVFGDDECNLCLTSEGAIVSTLSESFLKLACVLENHRDSIIEQRLLSPLGSVPGGVSLIQVPDRRDVYHRGKLQELWGFLPDKSKEGSARATLPPDENDSEVSKWRNCGA